MNRLLTAARYYVNCCEGAWGWNDDPEKAKRELLELVRDEYLLKAAQTITLERHSEFHDAADALVRRSGVCQGDMCDYHGHATLRSPCACTGGLCAGVTSDNLGPGGTRCRAHSTGD